MCCLMIPCHHDDAHLHFACICKDPGQRNIVHMDIGMHRIRVEEIGSPTSKEVSRILLLKVLLNYVVLEMPVI